MHDAAACGEPLHIAATKARGRAQRIGVIDQASTHDGHGLKTAMRMGRKARYGVAVVHPPTVFTRKVLAQVAPGQRRGRTHQLIAGRVGVVVINAEQKRVDGLPWKA